MIITPVRLRFEHTVSPEESRFLIGLGEGQLVGQRCPACAKVYVPPRGACPTDGVPTAAEVELPDLGIVTTFCVVNVPFQGQRVPPPYVAAAVLLDGADIPLPAPDPGLPAGRGPDGHAGPGGLEAGRGVGHDHPRTSATSGPTGEPDAPYESYAHHL